MRDKAPREFLWAVVRVDDWPGYEFRRTFNIKEVLPDQEEAILEVERLNRLVPEGGNTYYFLLPARYFPHGLDPPSTSMEEG
jgi:hypothetical protein